MSELVLEKNQNLPPNWVQTDIGSIGKIIHYGYTATSTKKDTGTRYLRITDIQNNSVDWNNVPFCKISQEKKPDFLLHENNIVFARTGGTVGKSFLIKNDIPSAIFASYLIRVVLTEYTDPKFIHFFFQSGSYWHQIQKGKTGLKTNVNAQILSKLVFQLPPLNEQKRIVEKIVELFSELNKIQTILKITKLRLKQYRQSIEKSIFEKLEKEYELKKLVEVCIKITDGSHHSPENSLEGEIPYITAKNIRPRKIDLTNITYISKENHKEIFARCNPSKGDVLYTKDGTVGYAVVNELDFEFSLLSSVALLKPNHEIIDSNYLEIFLNNSINYSSVVKKMSGTALRRIILKRIKEILLPLPSLDKQKEIVFKIQQIFSLIDNAENILNSKIKQMNTLQFSILKQAFEGKLVPQDPNDESAEILLEKIKQEKEQLKQKEKSKKRKNNGR